MSAHKYFVTGASGGLGLELAKAILADGHQLVAAVRRPDTLADLAAQYGERLVIETLDVTSPAQITEVAARHGDIDVLVNNAGGAVIGAMEELSDAEVRQQLDLNLVGPINLTRAFLPALRARGGGKIVYITSIGGRVGFAGGSMYHAAKFGLEGFAEALAQEIAEFGVQTLIIEPGSMATDFLANVRWTQQSDTYHGETVVGGLRTYIQDMGDDGIAGDPVKIADAILHLMQMEQSPLRTALGVDTYATLEKAYADSLATLEAQKDLAQSVAIEGKTGFMPGA